MSDSDLHPPEVSEASGIAWAELMEELPEASADDLRIDSPSDADLRLAAGLAPAAAEPPAPLSDPETTLVAAMLLMMGMPACADQPSVCGGAVERRSCGWSLLGARARSIDAWIGAG